MSKARLPVREPLLSLVRSSQRAEARLMGVWGTLLGVGGTGFCLYLIYYVTRRAMNYGELDVRTSEIIALVVGGLLAFLGALLLIAAAQAWRMQDDGGLLSDPDAKIVDLRRVVNRGGRWLEVVFDVNGTEVRPRWRFTSLVADENAEIAVCEAVQALPQWRGRGPSKQARAEAAVAQIVASTPRVDEGRRVAADAPFAQIHRAMLDAGLRLVSHVEAGVTLDPKPQDPIRADYEMPGGRALYFRDAQTGLQTVQVVGERAAEVFDRILNVGYLPVLSAKLVPMLEGSDRRDVLRALGAIEFVYAGKPGTYHAAQLARLAASDEAAIRDAARRAGAPQ